MGAAEGLQSLHKVLGCRHDLRHLVQGTSSWLLQPGLIVELHESPGGQKSTDGAQTTCAWVVRVRTQKEMPEAGALCPQRGLQTPLSRGHDGLRVRDLLPRRP